MLTSTFHSNSNFNGYSFFVYCLRLVVSNQIFPTTCRFDVSTGFLGLKRLKHFCLHFRSAHPSVYVPLYILVMVVISLHLAILSDECRTSCAVRNLIVINMPSQILS